MLSGSAIPVLYIHDSKMARSLALPYKHVDVGTSDYEAGGSIRTPSLKGSIHTCRPGLGQRRLCLWDQEWSSSWVGRCCAGTTVTCAW